MSEKRFSVLGLDVVFVGSDWMVDANGEEVCIAEEWGWWDDKAVYVWDGLESWLEKFGIVVHEIIERFLVLRLGLSVRLAHNVANVIEKVVTLGKAKLFWR